MSDLSRWFASKNFSTYIAVALIVAGSVGLQPGLHMIISIPLLIISAFLLKWVARAEGHAKGYEEASLKYGDYARKHNL